MLHEEYQDQSLKDFTKLILEHDDDSYCENVVPMTGIVSNGKDVLPKT